MVSSVLSAVPSQHLEEHCRTSPVSWHTCPAFALGLALGWRLHRDLLRCFSSAKGLLVGLCGSDVPSQEPVPPKLVLQQQGVAAGTQWFWLHG